MKKLKLWLIELPKNKLLMLFFIFIGVSLIMVFAGDVVVKEGIVSTSDNFTVDTNVFHVDASKNRVGVLTLYPLGIFHVKGGESGASVNSNGDEVVAENSGNAGISILSGNTSLGILYFGSNINNNLGRVQYDHSDNSLGLFTNSSQVVTIKDGKVGIGLSPVAYLDTQTSTSSTTINMLRFVNSFSSAGARPGISWTNSAGSVENARLSAKSGTSHTNSQFFIEVADSSKALQDRFTIDVNGRVGIGTTTPTHTLNVAGDENVTGTIYYGSLVAQSPHMFEPDEHVGFTRSCWYDSAGYWDLVWFEEGAMKIEKNSADCISKYEGIIAKRTCVNSGMIYDAATSKCIDGPKPDDSISTFD